MQDILVVVDMQNDFIDGVLGTKEAVAIVPKVEERIRNFKGTVLFTRDTHESWYLDTQEGKKLLSSLSFLFIFSYTIWQIFLQIVISNT